NEPLGRRGIHRVQHLLEHLEHEPEIGLLLRRAAHADVSPERDSPRRDCPLGDCPSEGNCPSPSSARGSERPRIRSAAFSPIMMQVRFVFPPGTVGITEASATRSPSTPITRSSGSTTERSPIHIAQVLVGCCAT